MIIRTWILSWVIDRTLSAQLGKPAMTKGDLGVNLYAELLRSESSIDDTWVAALAVRAPYCLGADDLQEWAQIMSRAHDVFGLESTDLPTPRSINPQLPGLVTIFEKQLDTFSARTLSSLSTALRQSSTSATLLVANVALYHSYARLVFHSFELQRALESKASDLQSAFSKVRAESQ